MCAAKIKKPKVIQSKEFLEIAGDFANPLEIVREAISNSFDANAKNIWLLFKMEEDYDAKISKITIQDDGDGMNEKELEAFFDLGNSTRRNDKEKIGEKGHGTKVYLNSGKIEVITVKNNKCLKSKMSNMKELFYKGQIPDYTVEEIDKVPFTKGTEIVITGFNNNKTDKFTHERLKDYILWFTKFGSVDKEFGITKFLDTKIHLKGIDKVSIIKLISLKLSS